jgi:UDPglucose--hexose-1-phosphate uridylyltransferase
MSELRKDPVVDRWVIIATERSRLPSDFQEVQAIQQSAFCPFCPGHEDRTPPEIAQYGRSPEAPPNSAGWQVRVVPNKFPVLTIDGDIAPQGLGMFDLMRGVGAHEVIIENPHHQWDPADASEAELGLVLGAYVDRIQDLRKDPRFRFIMVFRNAGVAAGATIEHPHSQVIALPITPKPVKEQLDSARDHYNRKQRCIYCDILRQEEYMKYRIVEADEDFVVLCPFASRFPFEMQILPRQHLHDFARIDAGQTAALARILSRSLRRLKKLLHAPAYNMTLHTAPALHPRPGRPHYWGTIENDFHWHIDILPRLAKVAGFEWANNLYINPVTPETAAEYLREVEV